MFQLDRFFKQSEVWEALLAKKVNERLPNIEDKGKVGSAALVAIGIAYTLLAVVFRVLATSALVAVYWLFRYVIPVWYVIFSVWFGVSSIRFLYLLISPYSSDLSVIAFDIRVIVHLLPTLITCLLYAVFYLSTIYVIAHLYRKAFFDADGK